MKYKWAIGNKWFKLRYVKWKGKDRIFADITDENGNKRTFRVK